MKLTIAKTSLWCLLIICAGCARPAADVGDITAMLHEFLSTADEESAHRRFWADDLVYTSSDGTRFGKAEIMAGFEEDESSDGSPAVTYSGVDVDVRVYGDVAVVTFKLVGVPADNSDQLEYFNTGTFLKRDGTWQVVAWQATKVPYTR